MAQHTRSAGRPSRGAPTIDRTAIGNATLDVLRQDGATQFSISKIASALGIRSQTLYYHVNSVAEAVNAARGVVLSRVDLAVLDQDPWDLAVTEFALAYYRAFQPLGRANSVFFTYPITDSVTLRAYERFLVRTITELDDAQRPSQATAHEAPAPDSSVTAIQLLLDIEHSIFSLIFEHTTWSDLFTPDAIDREGTRVLRNALARIDRRQETVERRLRGIVTALTREASRTREEPQQPA